MADEFNRNKLVNSGNLKDLAERVAGKIDSVRGQLEGSIGDLEGKLEGVDGTVADKIAAAKQDALDAAANAQAAAQAAQGDVDALEEKVGELPTGITSTTVVGYIGEKVAAEKTRAEAKEGELEAAINALKGEGTGSVSEQITAAKQELQGKIDTVSKAAQTAQTQADKGVADAAAAQQAANKAQSEVDALEGVVTQQKTDLQGAINGEAQAREAADNELQSKIDVINDSETGILKQAKDYTDTEVNKAKEETADVAADLAELAGLVGKLPDGATSPTVVGYVDEKVAALVDSAPEAMNTLNELAKAISDNKDVYDGYVAEHATAMAQMKSDLQKEIDDDVKVEVDRAKGEEGKIREEFAAADAGLLSKIEALQGLVGKESVESKVNAVQKELTKFKEDQAQKDADQDSAISTAKQDAIDTAAADATTKANNALADAKTYADQAEADAIEAAAADAKSKADKALADAKTYAESQAAAAQQAAAEDATAKADAAETNAKAHAESQAAAAQQAAAQDATTKANAAETNAKAHAEAKAAAAQQAAAADATTKADQALADAKADATTKANAAEANAKAEVTALQTKVVNTFGSLDLEVYNNKVHVTYEGAEIPLGDGIGFMTDGEVEAMLEGIFAE